MKIRQAIHAARTKVREQGESIYVAQRRGNPHVYECRRAETFTNDGLNEVAPCIAIHPDGNARLLHHLDRGSYVPLDPAGTR